MIYLFRFITQQYYNFEKLNMGSQKFMIKISDGFSNTALINALLQNSSNYTNLIINVSNQIELQNISDPEQAYLVGFAEGYLTAQGFDDFRNNYLLDQFPDKLDWPAYVKNFGENQINFLKTNIKNYTNLYWKDVNIILQQLIGITDGRNEFFTKREPDKKNISLVDTFLHNSFLYIKQIHNFAFEKNKLNNFNSRSSGIVFIDFKDIYLGFSSSHSYYNGFNRISKQYITSLKYSDTIKQFIQFLSAPGIIWPLDGLANNINQQKTTNTSFHFSVLNNIYQNFNKELYAINKTKESVFMDKDLISSVPQWANIIIGLQSATDFNTFKNAFADNQHPAQIFGSMFIDYSQFQNILEQCKNLTKDDSIANFDSDQECDKEVFKDIIRESKSEIIQLLEYNISTNYTTQFLNMQYALLLNTPFNDKLSTILNIPDDIFYKVNNSIRHSILQENFTLNKLQKDPLNTLETILTQNTGVYNSKQDFREGFAPRYDLQNETQQFGQVVAIITCFELQKNFVYWTNLKIPNANKPFQPQQLQNFKQMKGDLRQNDNWVSVFGCGNLNFVLYCTQCLNNFDIQHRCIQCLKEYVLYDDQCMERDDIRIYSNRITSFVLLSLTAIILLIILGILFWLICFLQSKKVQKYGHINPMSILNSQLENQYSEQFVTEQKSVIL